MKNGGIKTLDEILETLKEYDVFIGREIHYPGKENFVMLDLRTRGSGSCFSFQQVTEFLCYSVKSGKRILIYKSPGYRKAELFRESEVRETMSKIIKKVKEGTGTNASIMIKDNSSDEEYWISGRSYEPFMPEQLNILRPIYERWARVTKIDQRPGYRNPFEF